MKIGIFTDSYHPDVNGVVTSIKMVEKEMKKRGHEVYIFSPSKHEPTENENLYMLKSMPLFIAKKFDYRLATFYSRSIAKEIKELNLDIIHTQDEFSLGLFGKIISRKYDIPFIHTYHTMWEDYMHYIVPIKGTRNIYPKRFARNFSRSFMRKAECIIAPSKKTEKYLKYKCKVKNKPIYIVPTGIDISPFDQNNFTKEEKLELRRKLNIKDDEKIILFIGRVGNEKNIKFLIDKMPELFKKMSNCKFLIVGDGPAREELEEETKTLNIQDKVIFTGRVPWEDIAKYYSIGDVFVNSSVSETQGLTFIEAMASQVPIVAKYAPNLAELINNNKNGILVKNDKDFIKNILNVLKNEKLRKTLIEGGLKTAYDNSSVQFGDKLEEVYKNVIAHYKLKKKETNKKKIKFFSFLNMIYLKKKISNITKLYKKG